MSRSIRLVGLTALALCGCASVASTTFAIEPFEFMRPIDTPPIPEALPSPERVDRRGERPTNEPSWTGSAGDPLRSLEAWDAATHEARLARITALAARLRGWTLSGLIAFEDGAQRHEIAVFSHVASGIEFVLVPSGIAKYRVLGPDRKDYVGVCAPVGLPFLIARTELTCGAFAAASHEPKRLGDPSMPVSRISFTDADAWCAKAGLALPTAAQWEFACVAGAATRFCCGDDTTHLRDHAWIRENSDDALHPVAQKSWNAFGISDMHGNVREWCCGDAPDARGRRVAHGQGADAGANSFRRVRPPDDESWQTGFRPAFTVPAEALSL